MKFPFLHHLSIISIYRSLVARLVYSQNFLKIHLGVYHQWLFPWIQHITWPDCENSKISLNLGSSNTKSAAGLYYPWNFPVFCLLYLKNHSIVVSVIGYGEISLISSHKLVLAKIFIFSCAYILVYVVNVCYLVCIHGACHNSKIVNKYT